MKCVICSEYTNGEIELVGGYKTDLCKDHRNEFHEYANENLSIMYKTKRDNEIDYQMAVEAKDPEKMKNLAAIHNDIVKDFYFASKLWVQGKIDIEKKKTEKENKNED